MPQDFVVGIDIGGTNIKVRVLDPHGTIHNACDLPTEADAGPEHVIERMAQAARQCCTDAGMAPDQLRGVGVAAPGPLDMSAGVILRSVNLPGWVDVPLVAELQRSLQCPVALLNDASSAAIGEHWIGAGKGVDDLVLFTLGTGVGGGVISGGRPLFGHFGHGSELGHIIVDPNGRRCGCGQRGCLEAYAGESHINDRARELGVFTADGDSGVPRLLDAVNTGSAPAKKIWNDACRSIAIACVTLQHVLNPKLILLSGGVSASGATLLEPIRAALEELTWTMAEDVPEVKLGALGSSAGAVGAACWSLQQGKNL